MKEFKIADDDAGQRLDRFTTKAVPMLPSSLAQKYIRKKRIKVGGKPASRDYRLCAGDVVQMYINDEFFEKPREDKSYLKRANSTLDLVYEDSNIMLINKPAGILCHSADGKYPDTVISRVQAYLFKSGQWRPGDSSSFAPALCNRLDRNTSGIVIGAKNAEALRVVCRKIRDGEIDKYYLAVVHGIPKQQQATLEGFIFKDSVKNRVYVRSTRTPGAKSAAMHYRVLESLKTVNLSLLECRLITGRTHQLRAQLASIGHPIIGDGKYGRGDINRSLGESKQALCSYKVVFSFRTDAGDLSYLSGRSFELPIAPFKEKYFFV